jgi:hypothetical protein
MHGRLPRPQLADLAIERGAIPPERQVQGEDPQSLICLPLSWCQDQHGEVLVVEKRLWAIRGTALASIVPN